MREVTGYYDGSMVQLLESAPRTKQKVIVIFMDDEDAFDDLPVGILSKYADPGKRLLEEGAFERAMVEIANSEDVFAISERLIKQNIEAYGVLAK